MLMDSTNNHEVSILRPYNGSHHILPDGCPKVLTAFSGDESSRISYSFNSLGFRSEEFQITTPRHIFVCGGSVTLGLGLDYEDSWPCVFRRDYARTHGLQEQAINLQNFSSSGCANGYIARTLIGQCSKFQPTLALVELTFSHRAELLSNGRSYNIGPWCLLDSFDQGAQVDGHDHCLRQMIRQKAKAFYELDDELLAGHDLLKNALLLQLFFQVHEIPFLIGLAETDVSQLPDDPLLSPWIDSLDPERVFTIPRDDYRLDESVVAGHPGPGGSQAIAENFLRRYKDVYGQTAYSQREQPQSSGLSTSVDNPKNQSRISDSFKKWLGKKSQNSDKEDSNIYPLY